jgi:hypothetical protein
MLPSEPSGAEEIEKQSQYTHPDVADSEVPGCACARSPGPGQEGPSSEQGETWLGTEGPGLGRPNEKVHLAVSLERAHEMCPPTPTATTTGDTTQHCADCIGDDCVGDKNIRDDNISDSWISDS